MATDEKENKDEKSPEELKKEKELKDIIEKIGFKVDDIVIFKINLSGGPIQVNKNVECLVKSINPKGSYVKVLFAIQTRNDYKDEGSRIFEMNLFLIDVDEYDLKAKEVNGEKIIKYDREWSSSLRFYA